MWCDHLETTSPVIDGVKFLMMVYGRNTSLTHCGVWHHMATYIGIIGVNIWSGNGLLPGLTKAFSETLLTYKKGLCVIHLQSILREVLMNK